MRWQRRAGLRVQPDQHVPLLERRAHRRVEEAAARPGRRPRRPPKTANAGPGLGTIRRRDPLVPRADPARHRGLATRRAPRCRRSIMPSAGVTVMRDHDRGHDRQQVRRGDRRAGTRPPPPPGSSAGSRTATTISVANRIAPRISSDRLDDDLPVGVPSPCARCCRTRRATLSTSMTASSMSATSAMTRPARTIVFTVVSVKYRTSQAAASDIAIATVLTRALRQSKMNATRTRISRIAADQRGATRGCRTTVSMNSAGR